MPAARNENRLADSVIGAVLEFTDYFATLNGGKSMVESQVYVFADETN